MKTVETDTIEALRNKVKLAVDRADEKSLRRMHAILQIDEEAEEDILDTLHDDIRADVEAALKELDEGKGIPHEEAIKQLKQWPSK